jgi:glyoxylase-like metal-dependent hydrolase (beta-lactamase superfamily II)
MLAHHTTHRRQFLAQFSCFGAALGLRHLFPAPVWSEALLQDSRIAAAPLLDKGFASVRRIGQGVYATIADVSRGLEAVCNGGFLAGRDAALLVEGHHTPAGAALEFEALRMVSQVPVRAALDTHYHFDHSFGNSFYGSRQIPIMAHARTAPLIIERYLPLQGSGRAAALAPFENAVADARDDLSRQRAQGDLQAAQFIAQSAASTVLALPSLPLEPASLPHTLELGGIKAVIESYPGHTPTDLIVRVPEQNIVFTGDLLFHGSYPVAFDGQMSAWLRTLQTFRSWGKEMLFVPGHGPVCGPEGVAEQQAILEDLGSHAQKMKSAGVPVAEARQRYVIPEQFREKRMFSWGLCIGAAIGKFYEELP